MHSKKSVVLKNNGLILLFTGIYRIKIFIKGVLFF
jgi:hypothetical protein